jgi:glycosyltransferase involved in cell wall biosynthesis
MPAEPRVLFLGHGAERSGPPVFLLRLQRWLRQGVRPEHATVLVRGGALLPEFEALGPVRVLDRRWTVPRVAQGGLARLGAEGVAGTVRSARYRVHRTRLGAFDVAYVNSVDTGSIQALRALAGDVPSVVTHVHELSIGFDRLDPADVAHLVTRTDRFLVVSPAVADYVVTEHGVDPSTVVVAPGFVGEGPPPSATNQEELRRRLQIPEGAPVVVASGMTEWRKAPDLFVRLAWELRRQRPGNPTHVVWVGGDTAGPNWWPIEHDIRHLGLQDSVHFVGQQDRPEDWFSLADVFVATAREDALPLAALEAAALGRPLVSFENGGLPAFIRDHGAGVVVEYPRVDAMAEEVGALLEDESRRRSLGAAGAEAVRRGFTAEAVAPGIWDEVRRAARR